MMGVTLAFSQKQNLLETKSPQSTLGTKSLEVATKSQPSNPGIKSPQSNLGTKSPQLAAKPSQSNLGTKSPQLAATSLQSNLGTKSLQVATKSPQSNQSLSPRPKTTPNTIADGWIFIGNINKASDSAVVGKSLIKGSQFIDSPVVPSVGSIVTVTVRSGVMLRKNRPQKPNFNPKEQKALAIVKRREKLKILKVESVTPSNTPQPNTKVWAKVHRCGRACN